MQATQALVLYRTSIGKKIIMAVTGLVWIGFVFAHMYGNLKVFGGAAAFNDYAHGLRTLGKPIFGYGHMLFVARIALVASIFLHVWSAYSLTQKARKARPTDYQARKVIQANYASLTMRWGGLVLGLFIIFHLMHFTWGTPGVHNDFIHGEPYHNLVTGFQFLPAVLFYILAVSALAFHLYHGAWSMFQTLGINSNSLSGPIRGLSIGLALTAWVGFISVPLAVTFGFVTL